ncbi:MAG TPA: hypothetical protein VF690_03705 [Hymenobacter sp.]|jgi:hypothetical protein
MALMDTKRHLHLWRQLYDAAQQHPNAISLFFHLVMIAAVLLQDRAVLELSKIFDEGNSSINRKYLINLIRQQERKSLSPEVLAALDKALTADELKFAQYKDLITRIKTKRDKEIAHADRTRLTGDFDTRAKIEVEELDNIAQEVDRMFSSYYGICGFKAPMTHEGFLAVGEQLGFNTDFNDLFHVIEVGLANLNPSEQTESLQRVLNGRELQKYMNNTLPDQPDGL